MTIEEKIHKNMMISGRVQGVGFRYSVVQYAHQLAVKGFVRNLPDGDVYIEAEGLEKQVEEFIRRCRIGPPRARIDAIDISDGKIMDFHDFIVRY
jgi:acylphosphatase